MEKPTPKPDQPTRLQRLNAHLDLLHDGIRSLEGFKPYYAELEASYGHTGIFSELLELAAIVDPEDEPEDLEALNPAVPCFVAGAAFALDIAADVLSDADTDRMLCAVTEDLRRIFDALQDAGGLPDRAAAERDAILERSLLGYRHAYSYHDFIGQAKQTIAPEEVYERFVEYGFGYVMFATMAGLRRLDMLGVEDFEAEVLEEPRDWDEISRSLIRDYYREDARDHAALMADLTQDFADDPTGRSR